MAIGRKINLNIIFEIKSTNRKPIYAQLTENVQLKGARKNQYFPKTQYIVKIILNNIFGIIHLRY